MRFVVVVGCVTVFGQLIIDCVSLQPILFSLFHSSLLVFFFFFFVVVVFVFGVVVVVKKYSRKKKTKKLRERIVHLYYWQRYEMCMKGQMHFLLWAWEIPKLDCLQSNVISIEVIV